jgi:hypothetical protein
LVYAWSAGSDERQEFRIENVSHKNGTSSGLTPGFTISSQKSRGRIHGPEEEVDRLAMKLFECGLESRDELHRRPSLDKKRAGYPQTHQAPGKRESNLYRAVLHRERVSSVGGYRTGVEHEAYARLGSRVETPNQGYAERGELAPMDVTRVITILKGAHAAKKRVVLLPSRSE